MSEQMTAIKNDRNTLQNANGSQKKSTNKANRQNNILTRILSFSPRVIRIHTVEEPTLKNGLNAPPFSSTTPNHLHQQHKEKKINSSEPNAESKMSFFMQTGLPFVLAGLGMIGAGIILERASSCLFFTNVPEALILVPALLGLNSNLQMTLGSRLSTMVNMGQIMSRQQRITAFYSSVTLVQAQAIMVAFIASILAIAMHLVSPDRQQFEFSRAFALVLSAIVTASIASFIISCLMVLIVIFSRNCRLNPDNIVTPLAAAIGDVTSLGILFIFGTLFYRIRDDYIGTLLIVFFSMMILALLCMGIAARVPTTLKVLKYGWVSVIMAMTISSAGGYILGLAMQHFKGIGLFQPLINGVGGNLVAIQSSKISTYLHQHAKSGILDTVSLVTYLSPLHAFDCHERESSNAVILLSLSIPGHLLFILVLWLTKEMDPNSLHVSFLIFYILAALLQVSILLYCCQLLCRILWRRRWNPDDNAIPLLTALGDLLGTSLFFLAFFIHQHTFPGYYSLVDEAISGLNTSNNRTCTLMEIF